MYHGFTHKHYPSCIQPTSDPCSVLTLRHPFHLFNSHKLQNKQQTHCYCIVCCIPICISNKWPLFCIVLLLLLLWYSYLIVYTSLMFWFVRQIVKLEMTFSFSCYFLCSLLKLIQIFVSEVWIVKLSMLIRKDLFIIRIFFVLFALSSSKLIEDSPLAMSNKPTASRNIEARTCSENRPYTKFTVNHLAWFFFYREF